MQVLADLLQITDSLDEPRPGVTGMRACKPYTLDTGHFVDRGQQFSEVAPRSVWRLVVIDDLPEELDLLSAGLCCLPHVSQDVGLRPHALVSPRVRDDAERTVVVAAFDDRDVGLDGIVASGNPQRKSDVVPGVDVDLRNTGVGGGFD